MNRQRSQLVSWLVSWRFKLGQPQRIISGLKETFHTELESLYFQPSQPQRITLGLTFYKQIYIVERTNKAEIRPEDQSEKAESCQENLWNEIQLKGPKRQKWTQEHNNRERASWLSLCEKHKPQHAHRVKASPRGTINKYDNCVLKIKKKRRE